MIGEPTPGEIDEIAAGTLQLQPVDGASRPGAIAALGAAVAESSATWVARDIVTAAPRAYVALIRNGAAATVHGAAGLTGSAADAKLAEDVVRRYAVQALGLTVE